MPNPYLQDPSRKEDNGPCFKRRAETLQAWAQSHTSWGRLERQVPPERLPFPFPQASPSPLPLGLDAYPTTATPDLTTILTPCRSSEPRWAPSTGYELLLDQYRPPTNMWEAESWLGAPNLLDRRAPDATRPYVSTTTAAPASTHATDIRHQHCPSYKLPAYGTIEISPGNTITLDENALFRPLCTNTAGNPIDDGTGDLTSVADMRDPFHASITPQAYATGAATVIAWMLVIMLIITPRTFFVGNASGRSGLMGRRGMISGAGGGGSIIGVGTRPWLQKVAALTVAISLTLATADTFRIAERQYDEGFIDAMELRDQVVAGMEIKVSRVVSDIFLWLAQVQTLIRLFPRHKEKVIIKWVGFALILLDIAFSSLNSFGPYENSRRPAHFDTAIPALSYLFQLSLSMLYAAWVMYYAVTKRRYAFYHSMMWNMSVVALLSIIAILTPVVFFITDIANYTIAGWGDYFRWVGAAAASVIVWEWVERIEALEREERKDGILGREIYDGDDMLDDKPQESKWPSKRKGPQSGRDEKRSGGGHGGFGAFTSAHADRFNELAHRLGRKMTESPRAEARKRRSIHIPAPPPAVRRSMAATNGNRDSRSYVRVQTPPPVPVISSPVSRTDTTSADSTVYTVRYHPISETPRPEEVENRQAQAQTQHTSQEPPGRPADAEDPEKGGELEPVSNRKQWQWQALGNPFRRKGRTPPQELQRGQVIEPLKVEDVAANIPPRNYNGLALSDRLGTFAAQQGEKLRSRKKLGTQLETNLPVTIIPAQPRGQTWSPDIIRQQQKEQQDDSSRAGTQVASEEERVGASPAQSHGATNSSEAVNLSASSGSPRTPRIRFSPAVPNEREQASPGVLGAETTSTMDFSIPHQHSRSDHNK
ncbi:pH-response regulator protein palH/rim-21 [Pyrenophora tritici-repentis]|nr:pH-response regulator protein palH/rim-21 [Pyrenophora tritici-repentis]